MRIEELRLIVRPGHGLVVRYGPVVLLVAQSDDPAAADLIAAARGTDPAGAVDMMFEVVRQRPQVVAPFCALIQDGGELRVAIHGAMEILALAGESSLRVAGRHAASRVEESLGVRCPAWRLATRLPS